MIHVLDVLSVQAPHNKLYYRKIRSHIRLLTNRSERHRMLKLYGNEGRTLVQDAYILDIQRKIAIKLHLIGLPPILQSLCKV